MIRLRCRCQNYSWGKLGGTSEVAQLLSASSQNPTVEEIKIDENQPYAELWMGTHPKGPSEIYDTGEVLHKWLGANPSAVDGRENKAEEVELPFLFKVLSVNKALSIQVHPTKEQGRILHAQDPANYPDPNHKPEVAIALTPFELLCGFRPAEEILQNLREMPELFDLVNSDAFSKLDSVVKSGKTNTAEAKEALKACFSSLMNQPEPLVQKNLSTMLERITLQMSLQQSANNHHAMCRSELLIRLNYNFPGDVGCFSPFFLNHFVLQPGEAVFLAPNEPHAYLYGDCIECMACSDNTVRAGLTPKFKDVARLCEMLTYRMESADKNKFRPQPLPEDPKCVLVYNPGVEEFIVHQITVNNTKESYRFPQLNTCSIAIVIEGEALVENNDMHSVRKLSRGIVGLIPAKKILSVRVTSEKPLIVYRAFATKM